MRCNKAISRKISLDSDQRMEGIDFLPDDPFDKQVTLKGINDDWTESYEGGKTIFESLIEIPPDIAPIMQTQHYEDGNRYEGELVSGLREGFGTYYFSSGSKYDGNWKYNLFEGEGAMIYFNENKYEGNWAEGQKHGYGVMTSKNGNLYKGQWVFDHREGQGEEYFTEGTRY
jgi:hypothetical protein